MSEQASGEGKKGGRRGEVTNPFLLKLIPNRWLHLLVHLLEVTQTCLPSCRGRGLQTAEENLARGSGQKGHLEVLGDGVVGRELTSREDKLGPGDEFPWRCSTILVTELRVIPLDHLLKLNALPDLEPSEKNGTCPEGEGTEGGREGEERREICSDAGYAWRPIQGRKVTDNGLDPRVPCSSSFCSIQLVLRETHVWRNSTESLPCLGRTISGSVSPSSRTPTSTSDKDISP